MHKGSHLTQDHKDKISLAGKGQRRSIATEFKKGHSYNLGNKHFLGRKHSEKTKGLLRMKAKLRTGDKSSSWKGGRLWTNGYVYLLVAHNKYKAEHRLMAEKALGRKLKRSEIVHHINGKRDDNRNKNFIIMSNSFHRWFEKKMERLYIESKLGKLKNIADLYKKEHFLLQIESHK